jgi:hypothetical protein
MCVFDSVLIFTFFPILRSEQKAGNLTRTIENPQNAVPTATDEQKAVKRNIGC